MVLPEQVIHHNHVAGELPGQVHHHLEQLLREDHRRHALCWGGWQGCLPGFSFLQLPARSSLCYIHWTWRPSTTTGRQRRTSHCFEYNNMIYVTIWYIPINIYINRATAGDLSPLWRTDGTPWSELSAGEPAVERWAAIYWLLILWFIIIIIKKKLE